MRTPGLIGLSLCASIAAASLMVAACVRPGGAGGGPRLIVAYPQGLTEVAPDGSAGRVIVPALADGAPTAPAVSPDGRSIAYLMVPRPPAADADTGADLWVARIDGGGRRRLLRHPQPNHSVRSPAWQDDSHLLVVIDRPATCDGCNPETATEQTLERVDVRSGEVARVRRGVTSFGLAPDRRAIAYPDTTHESAAALLIAATPDGPARTLVPLAQGFVEITSMRFSPDGSRIAFAAADRRARGASAELVSRAASPGAAPSSDGLPANVWVVGASGSGLRLLAALREDQPAITWSADGGALYVIGTAALYRIDVVTGGVVRLGRGASHSALALVP